MKKLLTIAVLLMSLVLVTPALSKCIVSQRRVDPWTTVVLVDLDCNGLIDTVETWKWNGRQWILIFVRPY